MRRIATLPASWRAQIWLARTALEQHDLKRAIDLYHQCLSRLGSEIPADVLMQISGDLGKHGHLLQLLQLTEAHFKPDVHGLGVGNNLIKAYMDLGKVEEARRIVNQLYSVKRPDWRQTLSIWETEIANTRIKAAPVDQTKPLAITMICTEGPVWLKPDLLAAGLFSSKSKDLISVCFLGSSAEVRSRSSEVRLQMADFPGQLSRALPLFLAEQVAFKSCASVQTLTPYVAEKHGGFVLAGKPWPDQDAVGYAQKWDVKSDYVVISHLRTEAAPWSAELRLLETKADKVVGNISASFPSARPEDAIPGLADRLISLLVREGQIEERTPPALYRVPLDAHFGSYLLRLEQLLAVLAATINGAGREFLHGERSILDGNIELCVAWPDNAVTRILLAQTVAAMKRVRPDVATEFSDKLELLQREKPLSGPAHDVVRQMLSKL